MLPSVVASELEQVAAEAIRTAFHPTTPGLYLAGCGNSPLISNRWRLKWCTVLSSKHRNATSSLLAST